MFINNAFAAAPAVAETSALSGTLVQLALILLIFYFFLIRPQQKKIREHNAMVEALKAGEKVLLSSGIYGKITKINDDKISIEVAPNVEIVVDRMTIGAVITEEKSAAKTGAKTKKNNK